MNYWTIHAESSNIDNFPCVKTFCENLFSLCSLPLPLRCGQHISIYWRIVWGRCWCEWSRWVKCGITRAEVAVNTVFVTDDTVLVDLPDRMIAALVTFDDVCWRDAVTNNSGERRRTMPFVGRRGSVLLFRFACHRGVNTAITSCREKRLFDCCNCLTNLLP